MMALIIALLLTNEKGAYTEICSEKVTDDKKNDFQKLSEYAISFGKFITND